MKTKPSQIRLFKSACAALAAMIFGLGVPAPSNAATTTIFNGNFDNGTTGAVTDAGGLGAPAVGTWSFMGAAQGGITGDSPDKGALFAVNTTTPIPWVTPPAAVNTVVFTATYPNTNTIDAAGTGAAVFADFATPASFTGNDSTTINFSWGQCGTANSALCKYAFVRGLDASGNEVFELLFSQLNPANASQMYARSASDSSTVRTSASTATPQGTLLINGFPDITFSAAGSATITNRPAGMIGVTITLTNGQVTYAFSKGTNAGNAMTYPVNSAATTIAKLEFSTIAATGASGAIGYWLNNVSVTATTYSVTYDGNGSDGGTVPVDGSSPYVSGSTVTVLGNTGSLTKSGYAFTNWNTAANGSGITFNPGDTFTIASDRTLYAQWLLTSSAVITAPSNFPVAISTTYGTASSSTSVAVSGSGLGANLIANAPTGLEISSDGTTYGASATFTESGGNASGTLFVRFKTNAPAGSYNLQNIPLTSTAAATVNVALTASGNIVVPKPVTIDGAVAQDRLFNGTTAAVISGTLNGVTNGDAITLNGSGTFASVDPGVWTVTATCTLGGGSGTNNYTVTQPTGLTATILSSAIWTNMAGGNWGVAGNWTNGIVGGGSGTIADFSTVDLPADATVNLEAPKTNGNLIFSDTEISTTPAGWILADGGNPANTLTLAGTTPTVTVNALGAGKRVTISAVIAGTSGLVKAGAGTLILSATNLYSGQTTVSNGVLQLSGGTNRLKSGNNVFVDAAGTLDLNGLEQTLNQMNGPGTVTNTTPGILTINNSAQITNTCVIAGSGSVVKTGGGTLILAGANTYTGWTTNAGSSPLQIVNGSALGTTAGGTYIAAGSSLWIQGGITVGDEPLILNGGNPSGVGTFRNVNGNNTYGGLVTLAAPSIFACSTNTLTLSNPGTITGSGNNLTNFGNGNVTINSIIGTGSGSVTRLNGTGTLTLNGANTYTGPTAISANAGTILVNGSTAAGSTVTVNNGGFLGGTGVINGPVTYAAGSHAVFTNGATLTLGSDLNLATSGTIPNVYLNLSSNVPAGTYTLATYAGNLSGVFKSTPTNLTGSFAPNTTNYITTGSGSVVLHVESTAPANISFSISGATLSLSWPPAYLGSIVQSNSVNLADTNFWFDIAGSGGATNWDISIQPALTNVFYRLRLP